MLQTLLSFFVAAATLPLVSPAQLQPGASYTWRYYEADGTPYSTERYDFTAAAGPIVTFVMSSRMDHKGETAFRPSHKIVVDLRKCERAHRDPRVKANFLVNQYPVLADGTFATEPFFQAATAFEEKFNCNAWAQKNGRYETLFASAATPWGEAALFQQKRQPADQLVSWYFRDHPALKGVAYKKDFRAGSDRSFQMRLEAFSPAQ